MRRYGLIGYPLSHSFSQKYFTEKFEKAGITGCRYDLFPLHSIAELKPLLSQYPDLEGLNVTIPYKQQVMDLLDDSTHIPAALGACNCIRISKSRLTGYNTDWIGFLKSLEPLLQPHHQKALVLGSGGAAAAVLYALREKGITTKVVSRKVHPGADLSYGQLDEDIIREHGLIINTTPLGMYPHTDQCPAIPYQYLSNQHLLYDLVYNPAKTLFLQKGEAQGAAIKNGEEMLILQAEESWRIWNE